MVMAPANNIRTMLRLPIVVNNFDLNFLDNISIFPSLPYGAVVDLAPA
jgi:hypothetical protein